MFNIEQFQKTDTVLKFLAKLSVYLISCSKVKPSCRRFVSSFALRSASVELTSIHPQEPLSAIHAYPLGQFLPFVMSLQLFLYPLCSRLLSILLIMCRLTFPLLGLKRRHCFSSHTHSSQRSSPQDRLCPESGKVGARNVQFQSDRGILICLVHAAPSEQCQMHRQQAISYCLWNE